jgi:hypothetical protein
MIIWRGVGIFVILIVFCCSLVAQLLTNAISGTPTYWESHTWPFAAALLAAVPILWCVADALERRPGRRLVDPATGKDVYLRKSHELFFIPMKYWGAIVLAFAVLAIVTQHVPGPSRARQAQAAPTHQSR